MKKKKTKPGGKGLKWEEVQAKELASNLKLGKFPSLQKSAAACSEKGEEENYRCKRERTSIGEKSEIVYNSPFIIVKQ